MEYKLNVYADCTSEEPTKVYVCRRLLFKTATELSAFQEESQKAELKDQTEIMVKMLKCVFPNFVDEDLNGIDPLELGRFFKAISGGINGVLQRAEKNS